MSWVLDNQTNLTNESSGFVTHRRSANMQLNSCRKYWNEHMICGRMRTLVSKLGIQFGLKQQISQLMSHLWILWASDTAPLRSRTSSQIWPTALSCQCSEEFMMFSMLTFFQKQSPTWFCDIGSQCHLLLRSTMRTSGLWKSMLTLYGSKIVSNSRYNGMDFQRSMTLGKTWMALIPTMGPASWERRMTILI